MKEPNLEQLFMLFVATDELRPALMSPFEINGYVYATDACVLIKTELLNYKYNVSNDHHPPNPQNVIPSVNMKEIINFGLTSKDLEKYKTCPEFSKCSSCEGEGEVTWKFENHTMDAECPDCDGTGEGDATGIHLFDENTWVKIGICTFRVKYIFLLLKAQEVLGGNILLLSQLRETAGNLFSVGNCEIVIMPVSAENIDHQLCSIKIIKEISFN